MKSRVAEETREAQRRRVLELSPEERIRMALTAGRRLAELYADFHGVTIDEARRALKRAGAVGRRPCSWQDTE
jgi:hypothetical protein